MRRPLCSPVLVLLATACGGGATAPTDPLPTTGLYAAPLYASAEITRYVDIAYSRRPNARGRQYTSGTTIAQEQGQPELVLRMDIGVPPNATAPRRQPLLVFVHGGGFVTGDKRDFLEQMEPYARAGYVVASINYRLTPGGGTADTLCTTTALHAIRTARPRRRRAARNGRSPAAPSRPRGPAPPRAARADCACASARGVRRSAP